MARNVYIVNATQVVTSEAHPEGLFSVMSGYPKNYDSMNYASEDAALRAAKAAYYDQLGKNYAATNRAMTTLTLVMANGKQILRDSEGAFPVVPEPVAEEPEE